MSDSSSGASWTSFLSSIRNDINDIKNAVSEGANELYTYIKDAVPEDHQSTQSEENQGISSRIGGFLSSTLNNAKSLFGDVFDEQPSVENEQEDKDELLRILRTTESTYTTISEDETEDFSEWLKRRDIVYIHSIKASLIKEQPIIQVMYRRLVPAVVSDTTFWNNYFYHIEKYGYKKTEPTPTEETTKQEETHVSEKAANQEMEALQEGWSDGTASDNNAIEGEELTALEEAIADVSLEEGEKVNLSDDDWDEWE